MLRSAMALRPLQPLWRSATGTIPRVSPAATQLLRRTAGSEAAQTQETKPTTPETASETEALRKQVDRSLLRQLRFDEYMRIKRLHKRIGYAVAVPGYFTGAFVASAVCIDKLPPLFPTTPEEVQLVMGMEPLVVAAIACTATGIVFALGGAALYNALWRMLNKDLTKLMDARDLDFRLRIIENRAGALEFSHDFYGDKIKTTADYHKWLREQRKIRHKLETGVSLDLAKKGASAASK